MAKFDVENIPNEVLLIMKEDDSMEIPWSVKDLLKVAISKAGDKYVLEKKDINSSLYKLLKLRKVVKLLKMPDSTPLWKSAV